MSNIDLDKSGRIPQNIKTWLGPSKGWVMTDSPVDLEFPFDAADILAAGVKPFMLIPDWLYVNDWIVLATTAGSCQVDFWKTTLALWLAGTVPTSANSITGSDKPRLVSQVSRQGTALTGWTRQINQNDILVPVLDSVSGLSAFSVYIRCVRVLGNPF